MIPSLNVKEFKRAGGSIGVRLAVLYLPSRYFNLRDLVVVPVVDCAYDEREKGGWLREIKRGKSVTKIK